jgi:hypothetical protein
MGNNWHKLAIASKNLLKQSLDMNPNEAWPYIIFADNYASSCNERFEILLKAWEIDPTNVRCSQTLQSLSRSPNISKYLINRYITFKDTFVSQHEKFAIPIKYSNCNKKDLEIEILFSIEDDKILLQSDNYYNLTLDFIIEHDWRMKLGYSHEFLSKNKTFVYGAGCLSIDKFSKKIIYLDNKSGHFQPTIDKFNKQVFPLFKRLIDLSKLQVMYFNASSDSSIACGYLPTLMETK